VGTAFRALVQRRPELELWGSDGLHPSIAGTYLAACSFYAHFYQHSPVGNSYHAGLAEGDARALQEMAALLWKLPDAVVFVPATQPASAKLAPAGAQASQARPKPSAAELATEEADRLRHERVMRQIRQHEVNGARDRVPINVYRTSWCHACEIATSYMRRAGISFEEYDVERDPEAREVAHRLNPRGSVPTIDVDGTVLVGWNETRFQSALQEATDRRAH
jgi:glutaredoxin